MIDREALLPARRALRILDRKRGGLHHREARLLGPASGEAAHVLAALHGERVPEVGGGGVEKRVLLQIAAHAVAKDGLAEPLLDHAEHGLAFFVGDLVEGVARLALGFHRLLDRVRGRPRVQPHGSLAACHRAQPRLPFGMPPRHLLRAHPAREALVQPQVIPPRHGHEIAKPLVRDLVRHDAVDALALRQAARRRVEKQRAFPIDDRAPVLHAARAGIGQRDLVELGQRIFRAEVVREVAQNFLGDSSA